MFDNNALASGSRIFSIVITRPYFNELPTGGFFRVMDRHRSTDVSRFRLHPQEDLALYSLTTTVWADKRLENKTAKMRTVLSAILIVRSLFSEVILLNTILEE